MSSVFQLPTGGNNDTQASPFRHFGLDANPFPSSGVDTGVLFTEHMEHELNEVNAWIQRAAAAASFDRATPQAIEPLALFGSLGVGKTHLLRTLERGLGRDAQTPVLRRVLTEEGAQRLVFADLFLRHLPGSAADGESDLLERIVTTALEDPETRDAMVDRLSESSPIRAPFLAVLDEDAEANAVLWFSRWLRREYTTPAQRAKLRVASPLRSEGQAVRAVADLMRLAHAARLVRVWFVMIDQLEELWRPNVISPTRRARFLTDLRMLIDLALEGAPIAVLLAWNTTVNPELFDHGDEVATRMRADYRALWQRLGKPVDLPTLEPKHVWPFAQKYLEHAGAKSENQLYDALRKREEHVRKAARTELGQLAPRRVLETWRHEATRIADRQTSGE